MTLLLLGFHSKKLAIATARVLNAPLLWSLVQRKNTTLVTRLASSSSLSSKKQHECDGRKSFTVSYLVDSCGLSPERALSLSRRVKLESPTNPDSVLDLLRTYGLTDAHISRAVKSRPNILLADPQKTLLPKLEKMLSIGFPRADIGSVVAKQPSILTGNIENGVLSCIAFLKNDVGLGFGEIVKAMKTNQRLLSSRLKYTMAPNVALLRELGMPQSFLPVLVTCHAGVLCLGSDKFRGCVNKAVEMGYDPVKSNFGHALALFAGLTESTRQRKMELYRRWGWSEEQIQVSVQKYPVFMCVSEKKFELVMDFLVNKAGWQTADCARSPFIFTLSFEKRIKPRFSVVAILLSKGLVTKRVSLTSIACISEMRFLGKFVNMYRHDIPELVDAYEGRTPSGLRIMLESPQNP